MFHRKDLIVKKGKTKRLSINNFAGGLNSVLDDAYIGNSVAKISYNVCGESGALKEHLGAKPFVLVDSQGTQTDLSINEENISRIWLYRRFDDNLQRLDDRIVLLTAQNKLYQVFANNLQAGVLDMGLPAFTSPPQAVNFKVDGQDLMLFCSPSDALTVYDGQNPPFAVDTAPNFCGMCVHYDRLFAFLNNDREKLWFSDDLNPTNWSVGLDEAGHISMTDQRGGISKLVSFLNYLYIFRDYGISRLTASGSQESFYLSHLFVAAGKIIGDTVTLCGNKIIFLTENGLYSFNGSSAQKIMTRLDGLFKGQDNSHATATFFDNNYYLSCNIKYDDDFCTIAEKNGCTNNALLEIKLLDGTVNILRGFDIASIVAINGDTINKLLFTSGENQEWACSVGEIVAGGKLFGSNTPKRWVCPKTDVDSQGMQKKLNYIMLTTLYDLTLCVETDGEKHWFDVVGKALPQKITVNLIGQEFRLSFCADTEKMYVLKPELYFREY